MSFLYGMGGIEQSFGRLAAASHRSLDPSYEPPCFMFQLLSCCLLDSASKSLPPLSTVGTGCLPRSTNASDGISVCRFQIVPAFAILFRVVYIRLLVSDLRLSTGMPNFNPMCSWPFSAWPQSRWCSGNFIALKQTNMKRLLAYSGIANAGYLLVPLGIQLNGMHSSNFSELFFYLIAYYFMNLGIFAVLMVVSRAAGHEEMSGFAGLYHRKPGLAIATLIFVLSLAEFVYGRILRKVVHFAWNGARTGILARSGDDADECRVVLLLFQHLETNIYAARTWVEEIRPTTTLSITIWICAALSLLLGLFPQWVLTSIERIFRLSTYFFIF